MTVVASSASRRKRSVARFVRHGDNAGGVGHMGAMSFLEVREDFQDAAARCVADDDGKIGRQDGLLKEGSTVFLRYWSKLNFEEASVKPDAGKIRESPTFLPPPRVSNGSSDFSSAQTMFTDNGEDL